MDDVSLWKRTQLAPDDEVVTLPSPEDVMLITVAHSFYENKEFRLADIVKIRECWRGAKIDWEYLERVAEGQGWLDGLHFCLLVCAHLEKTLWGETSVPLPILRDWEASLKRLPLTFRYYQQITRRSSVSLPFTISFLFSKFLYYKKILHNRHCSPVRRLWDVIRTLVYGVKLKANIRPQPSLLVSFSGPDGSGKTCHAQTLRSSLYWCGLKSNYYWSRTGTSWLIRFSSASVKALIGSKLKGNEQKLGVAGRKERLRNPLLRFCWCYLTAADMVWSHLLRVRLPLLLGKIVVCDRYVFDAAAEMECTLSPKDKLTRLAIKLMLALAPKPDAGYLFDVPDEVSAQRKVEDTDADYLRQQRKAYAQLAARYHLRVKRTDGDFSTITDEITREILLSYFDHFETFLNGLFLSNPKQLNKRKW
jgi:dTMP kinase